MNGQQIHLLVNHLPIVGALWSILLLVVALARPTPALKRLALAFTLLVAVATVPAFLSGEPAEEVVEHLPGTDEAVLERHEDLGKRALAAGVAAGVVALIGLFWSMKKNSGRGPLAATLVLLLVAALYFAWTGHLGGQIRRPELRGDPVPTGTDQLHEQEDH